MDEYVRGTIEKKEFIEVWIKSHMITYLDSSHYIELPRPDQIADYEKYKSINWIKEDKVENNKTNFKFNL